MHSTTAGYVSEEEVKTISELARIRLSDTEISEASENISAILGNFEMIRSIDTNNSIASDNPSGAHNVSREDVVHENILTSPDVLLKNARTQDGYVVVPAVFSP